MVVDWSLRAVADLGMDASDASDVEMTDPIPLQNVNAAILKKVVSPEPGEMRQEDCR